MVKLTLHKRSLLRGEESSSQTCPRHFESNIHLDSQPATPPVSENLNWEDEKQASSTRPGKLRAHFHSHIFKGVHGQDKWCLPQLLGIPLYSDENMYEDNEEQSWLFVKESLKAFILYEAKACQGSHKEKMRARQGLIPKSDLKSW